MSERYLIDVDPMVFVIWDIAHRYAQGIALFVLVI